MDESNDHVPLNHTVFEPLVSIVIPTYNQNLDYLKACIESALNQTYSNIEVIVSNNHSTNGTDEFLASLIHSKIRKIKTNSFLSMNESFGFAASYAEGEYIAFLSSDDLITPDCIEKIISLIRKDDRVVFAFGNLYASLQYDESLSDRRCFTRSDKFHGVLSLSEAFKLFVPWTTSSGWMAGAIIKKSIYLKTGGLGASYYKINSDVWLTAELLRYGLCACTSDITAFFRLREPGVFSADGDRRLLQMVDWVLALDHFLEVSESISLSVYDKLRVKLIYYLFPHRVVYVALSFVSEFGQPTPEQISFFEAGIKIKNIKYLKMIMLIVFHLKKSYAGILLKSIVFFWNAYNKLNMFLIRDRKK